MLKLRNVDYGHLRIRQWKYYNCFIFLSQCIYSSIFYKLSKENKESYPSYQNVNTILSTYGIFVFAHNVNTSWTFSSITTIEETPSSFEFGSIITIHIDALILLLGILVIIFIYIPLFWRI